MKTKCTTAKHCGGLKETLKTEKEIQETVAWKLINSGVYQYYTYDERIHAHRYLIVDIPNNLGLPEWLHIYDE